VPRIQDLPTHEERVAATADAREKSRDTFAGRAVDDPVKLARAARIVRIALARQRLTLDELLPTDRGAAA
jgi:hypothetical protein